MTSFHAQAIEKILDERIKDPAWAVLLVEVHRKLRHHEYGPPLLVDAIFQNHTESVGIEDALAFTLVWSSVMAGELCLCEIEVGHEPHEDRARDLNREVLSRLPIPFAADVSDQNCADSDGGLSWGAPIRTDRQLRTEQGHAQSETWMAPPSAVPLEIGSTKASRTALHVRESRALARWPYGHKSIMLFIAHPSALHVSAWDSRLKKPE